MGEKTTAERLIEVQEAISRIVTGAQSYVQEGVGVTRARLLELRALEKELKRDLLREQRGGGIRSRRVVPIS